MPHILGVGIRFNRSSASDSVDVNAIPFVNYKQPESTDLRKRCQKSWIQKIFTQQRQFPYCQHLH